MQQLKSIGLPLLILLLALLPRVTTLSGTFITTDEPLFWEWSNQFAKALLDLDWQGTLVGKGYPYITVTWVHSLGFAGQYLVDILLGQPLADFRQQVALDQPFTFALLGQRRLTIGLANSLLILLVYLQARKLLGERIAFLGATLMAFAPFLLSDSRTMRGDALMSSLMLLSVFSFLRFLREQRRGQLILSGIGMGLALLTKIAALPLVGFVGLAVIARMLRPGEKQWPARLRWAVMTLAGWGGVVLLTVVIFWPALWVSPLAVYDLVHTFAISAIDGRTSYFWGQLFQGDRPIPLFYPVSFLFRATPLVILGVVVVLLLIGVSLGRLVQAGRQSDNPLRRFLRGGLFQAARLDKVWRIPTSARWSVLALVAYAVIYGLVLNEGALKRDRYLMPVFPAAMFIAAAGLLWLICWASERWPGQKLPGLLAKGRWTWFVFLLLVGVELGYVWASHPYYYTYWNPLLGGGRVAMGMLWAEGGVDSAAVVRLAQEPNAAQETIAMINLRDFAPIYPGESVRLVNNSPWITADHIILRQYHYQTEKMEPTLLAYLNRRPLEFSLDFQGYTWAEVYPGPAAQYYAGSGLEGQAELLGYNLSGSVASPAQPLQLKLFWHNQGYQPDQNDFFVRLVDAGGFSWAETVARPFPEFETAAGQFDAFVESEAQLSIPPGTPPGLYFLKIGLSGHEGEPDVGLFTLPSEANKIVVEKRLTPTEISPDRPFATQLGPLTLLGADVEQPFILIPPRSGRLWLYWQAEAKMTGDYHLVIQLVNVENEATAQWSGLPARGLYPLSDWQPGELIRDPWTLDASQLEQPDRLTPGRYTIRVVLLAGPSGPQIGQTTIGHLQVVDRQRFFTLPPAAQPLDVHLAETITLIGYQLEQAPLMGGARFSLDLYWQTSQPLLADYTVFTQVLGPDGAVVGQHDGPPAKGLLPTTMWEVGEVVPDRHRLDVSIAQSGQYRLIAGMYDPTTGARLPLVDTQDGVPADFIQLHTFTSEAMR